MTIYDKTNGLMTGGADENEGYVTLQTLVETAKNKLDSQQQQS